MEQPSIRDQDRAHHRDLRAMARRASDGLSHTRERAFSRMHDTLSPNREVNVGDMERMASAAAGTALLLSALGRRSLGGALMALGGGALVYRGLSGYCAVNRALGRNTACSRPASQGTSHVAARHEQLVADEAVMSAASGA